MRYSLAWSKPATGDLLSRQNDCEHSNGWEPVELEAQARAFPAGHNLPWSNSATLRRRTVRISPGHHTIGSKQRLHRWARSRTYPYVPTHRRANSAYEVL
jgi:hypothetical protein